MNLNTQKNVIPKRKIPLGCIQGHFNTADKNSTKHEYKATATIQGKSRNKKILKKNYRSLR